MANLKDYQITDKKDAVIYTTAINKTEARRFAREIAREQDIKLAKKITIEEIKMP